jgi:hypothetical protein
VSSGFHAVAHASGSKHFLNDRLLSSSPSCYFEVRYLDATLQYKEEKNDGILLDKS